MSEYSYTCSCCGQVHEGIPDLAFAHPHQYHVLAEAERADAMCNEDFCRIGNDGFIRGVLRIPVHGLNRYFGYGVWVSLSAEHFQRYAATFDEPAVEQGNSWFGWLCNRIPGYPDTLLLKTHVRLRPHPDRPDVELEPTDHPLALEQHRGISERRLQEILETNRHPPAAA